MTDFLHEIMEKIYADALQRGFPPFLLPGWESTPVNALPYWVPATRLAEDAAASPVRSRLVGALLSAWDKAPGLGADLAMVGGSLTGWPNPRPRDMDRVLLYSAPPGMVPDTVAMRVAEREVNANRVDMRLAPVDGDPLVLVRTVSFFTMPYMKRHRELSISRAILLVDFRA